MKPNPLEQELLELAWRRPLSPAEQVQLDAGLKRDPEARADWEAEAALTAALSRLPATPAPSNLIARVLSDIDRAEAPSPAPVRHRALARFGWLPRLALVVAGLAGGLLWYHDHRAAAQADALARLATITDPGAMPSAEALENFDVILKLHPSPAADTELLSLSRQLAEFHP